MRRMRRIVKLAGLGIFLAAVSKEMAKPESERTWHGQVGGFVPYDFRPPTWDRLRAAYWNPRDDRLFTDRVFGVGWAINLYRARDLMVQGYESLMGGSLPAAQRWRQRTSRVKSAESR